MLALFCTVFAWAILFLGYIAFFHWAINSSDSDADDELPVLSPTSSSSSEDDDAARHQEGRKKRVCRCGECLTAARKRARRSE